MAKVGEMIKEAGAESAKAVARGLDNTVKSFGAVVGEMWFGEETLTPEQMQAKEAREEREKTRVAGDDGRGR